MPSAQALDLLLRTGHPPAEGASARADAGRDVGNVELGARGEGRDQPAVGQDRVSRLEQPQAVRVSRFEGEFDLLLGEVELSDHACCLVQQGPVDVREILFEGTAGVLGLRQPLTLGDGKRLHEAADHVVTLTLYDEIAEESDPAGLVDGVARAHDARSGLVVEVPEYHALDHDGGAPLLGDVELSPVEPSLVRVPGLEDKDDAEQQLLERIVENRDRAVEEQVPVLHRQASHPGRRQERLLGHAAFGFCPVDELIEEVTLDPVAHPPELHEASVGVPCGPRSTPALRDVVREHGVDPDVEQAVEHARHADGRTSPHGKEQRSIWIPETGAGLRLELLQLPADHLHEVVPPGPPGANGLVQREEVGRDDEPGWHGEPVGHQSLEVRALVSQEDDAAFTLGLEGDRPASRAILPALLSAGGRGEVQGV